MRTGISRLGKGCFVLLFYFMLMPELQQSLCAQEDNPDEFYASLSHGADPSLITFLKDIKTDVETHAWMEFVDQCSPANVYTQMYEFGISAPQYIAETMGLFMVGNSIDTLGDGLHLEDLEKITKVVFRSFEKKENGYLIKGNVILKDGLKFDLSLEVIQEDGKWVILGGVG
jgi:hypothetical protein